MKIFIVSRVKSNLPALEEPEIEVTTSAQRAAEIYVDMGADELPHRQALDILEKGRTNRLEEQEFRYFEHNEPCCQSGTCYKYFIKIKIVEV
jgi:hypothetical protein